MLGKGIYIIYSLRLLTFKYFLKSVIHSLNVFNVFITGQQYFTAKTGSLLFDFTFKILSIIILGILITIALLSVCEEFQDVAEIKSLSS